jgi:DNA polymerase-1
MKENLAFDDIQIMEYVAHTGLSSAEMEDIAPEIPPLKDMIGSGKAKRELKDIPAEELAKHACEVSSFLFNKHAALKQELFQNRQLSIYEKIEKPMINVLATIERRGAKIDVALLGQMSAEFERKLKTLETEIHQLAGTEFNIGSPQQLGEVLFEKMKLEGGKKSKKTGSYGTGADVLEELSLQGAPIADKVLEWRQISKLKSTYTDALPNSVNPKTGRVHTCFNMTVASTGRLSSTNPNLQNIPIRSEEGRKIRNTFIAEKGNKLISADYSQIELRLLAHVADIGPLKEAFKNGEDVHSATARQVFGVTEVDAEHRRMAKTINFGIIYGLSAHGLAQRLGIGRDVAAKFIAAYFNQYPGIKAYMDSTIEYCRAHGYVETILGRKLYIKGINDKNYAIRSFSERAAINAPLQGSAADIIKKAMIELHRLNMPMILQVHDELLLEVPEDKAQEVMLKVKSVMENSVSLSVPVVVDAKLGNNWGEAH